MSQKKEVEVLAEVLESTRILTKWYLSKLKDVDMHRSFNVEGVELNSPYWLLGHLIWAENTLLLKALGGEEVSIPWIEKFGFGTKLSNEDSLPELDEMFSQWKVVHTKAVEHLKSIEDEKLDEENIIGFSFGPESSKRTMVHHVIRHEAIHSGQLGWICKLHGIKTV